MAGEDLWLNWDQGLGDLLLDDGFFDDLFASSPDVADEDDASSPQKQSPNSEDEKRQIKLHRNRLSASLSRQRKKSYMRDLEAKCKVLEARSEQLQRSVEYVNAENVLLKEELARLKGSSRKGAVEPAVLDTGSLPLEYLSHLIRCCLWWGAPLLLLLLLGAWLLPLLPLATSAAATVAASTRGGALLVLSLGTPSAHVDDELPTRRTGEMRRLWPP